jgi:hypothetical protein
MDLYSIFNTKEVGIRTAMLNCILFLLYLLALCGNQISKNVKVVTTCVDKCTVLIHMNTMSICILLAYVYIYYDNNTALKLSLNHHLFSLRKVVLVTYFLLFGDE